MLPFGFKAKKDRGIGFSVLAAREIEQEPKNERGKGEERKQRFFTFLPHPLPVLLLAPFFARSRAAFFAPKPHGNAFYAGYIVWCVILIFGS